MSQLQRGFLTGHFPLEIYQNIFKHSDKQTLTSACLVSISTLAIARDHLYSHVNIRRNQVNRFLESVADRRDLFPSIVIPLYIKSLRITHAHTHLPNQVLWQTRVILFWSSMRNLEQLDLTDAGCLINSLLQPDQEYIDVVEELSSEHRFELPKLRKIRLQFQGKKFFGFHILNWHGLNRFKGLKELEIIVEGNSPEDELALCGNLPHSINLEALTITANFSKHVPDFIRFIGPTKKVFLCDTSVELRWCPMLHAIPDTISELTLLYDLFDYDSDYDSDDKAWKFVCDRILNFDLGKHLIRFQRLQHLVLGPRTFNSSRQFFLSLPPTLQHLQLIGVCEFKLNELIPLLQRHNSKLVLLGIRVPHHTSKKWGGMRSCTISRARNLNAKGQDPTVALPACDCCGSGFYMTEGTKADIRPKFLHHMKHFDRFSLMKFIELAESKGVEVYGYEVDSMKKEIEEEENERMERLAKRKMNVKSRRGRKGKK